MNRARIDTIRAFKERRDPARTRAILEAVKKKAEDPAENLVLATAEALMRSRYTAYTLQDIDYLASTLDANQLRDFDRDTTETWARDSNWLGLEIVNTSAGSAADKDGTVEFKARYERDGADLARVLAELIDGPRW